MVRHNFHICVALFRASLKLSGVCRWLYTTHANYRRQMQSTSNQSNCKEPTATRQPLREFTFFTNDQTEQQPCTEEKTKPTVARWLHWIFWCQRPSVQYPQPLGDHEGACLQRKPGHGLTAIALRQIAEFANNCWCSQSAPVKATHLWCTSLQ